VARSLRRRRARRPSCPSRTRSSGTRKWRMKTFLVLASFVLEQEPIPGPGQDGLESRNFPNYRGLVGAYATERLRIAFDNIGGGCRLRTQRPAAWRSVLRACPVPAGHVSPHAQTPAEPAGPKAHVSCFQDGRNFMKPFSIHPEPDSPQPC
jgi:hypothetical protein